MTPNSPLTAITYISPVLWHLRSSSARGLSGGYRGPCRSISMPNSEIVSSSTSCPTTTTA